MIKKNLFSQLDLKTAGSLETARCVFSVVFSQGTYQVEVVDPSTKEVFWPFLQLNDQGEIQDHFCSCLDAHQERGCLHQAMAWVYIMGQTKTPLHVRFRWSLWYQLGLMGRRWIGDDPQRLKTKIAFSPSGKKLFSMTPRTPEGEKRLNEILFERVVETEETSLKFSNLPPEEIALWKEGNPSRELQYELSFWSDLAKWWMILQEKNSDYTLTFSPLEPLPSQLIVEFNDIEFSFYIAKTSWREIVPTLLTVRSPISVFEGNLNNIRKVLYDPLKKAFLIDFIEDPKSAFYPPSNSSPHTRVGNFVYIPGSGFYPAKEDSLLAEKIVPSNKVGLFLQNYSRILQKYLVGTKIHPYPISIRYHLFLDQQHRLNIEAYVQEIGDLQKVGSSYFKPWAYLPDQGFYALENEMFEEMHLTIAKESISDFINRHRQWLSFYEGFQPHVSHREASLCYTLTSNYTLRFDAQLDVSEEEGFIDLGEWLYLRGRGFYTKAARKTGSVLKPGLTVEVDQISNFIRAYHDELETISHFFSSHTPLKTAGLSIDLNEKEEIVIKPQYVFNPPYQEKDVLILEGFTYVEKEGFFEIPTSCKLPEPYFKERIIHPAAEPFFVSHEIETLSPYILICNPRLRKPKHLFLQIIGLKKEEDGWILELEYQSEEGKVTTLEIWEAIKEGRKYLFSSAGLIFIQGHRFNWLKSLPKKRWLKKGAQVKLSALECIRLFALEEIKPPEDVESFRLFQGFHSFDAVELLDITGLKSQLRTYQETGLKWLWFLYCQKLSGLLCDEMGLGKTHQAMGLIAAVLNGNPQAKIVVICPTSVLFHWQELLKKFLPQIPVVMFYGLKRNLMNWDKEGKILLTSYGILRSEKKLLSSQEFTLAIFDEIQIAKNSHSQTHKALKSLQAITRIGLTGTPIENRLLELKSLLDVVIPGYMPQEATFKELFVNPIEKQQDAEKKVLLTRLTKPFILRRKKKEVLLELPEKTEEIAYVPLSEQQNKLYQETYKASKEGILKEINDKKQVSYLHIFSLLTRLKQICDHPILVLEEPISDYKKYSSGKWDLFVQLLQQTRESSQKLVVFSQYLKMLDIIELYLKEEKIGYASIRGSTRDRKRQMDLFRDDPKCEVFLGSLQAAGVGIDLVAASVVIHYDRWWNPAKENQATDRVHRLGQSRGVQVFKMVTKTTIEEHIHRLIERKEGLLHNIIACDDQDEVKALSKEELLELLKMMEEN